MGQLNFNRRCKIKPIFVGPGGTGQLDTPSSNANDTAERIFTECYSVPMMRNIEERILADLHTVTIA